MQAQLAHHQRLADEREQPLGHHRGVGRLVEHGRERVPDQVVDRPGAGDPFTQPDGHPRFGTAPSPTTEYDVVRLPLR